MRSAVPADLHRSAQTLAEAFTGDPVWDWLIPPDRHERRLRRLFGALLGYALPRGRVFTAGDGQAVAIWSPPGQWKLPPREVARHAVPMARSAGVRLPRLMRRLGDIERIHPADPPHWYLEFIGTATAAQGRGLGSELLSRFDPQGFPVYLESSNPKNLPFYERHGFTVTGEVRFRSGPPQWTLWRDGG